MPEPLVRLAGVCYSYGLRRALDRVDLEIGRGEVCALVGPNGAGKSTLIRIICGRLSAEAGSVRVDGGDPSSEARARSAIGFAPQDLALYPKLTVKENLKAFADLSGVAPRRVAANLERAIASARLERLVDQRIEALSGGERRRANVAAALVGEPRLLILDEPTVGIDADSRAALHETIRAMRRDGVAVLLATHDLDQAEVLSDHVALIVGGRIAARGPARDLLAGVFGADAQEVTVVLAGEPEPGAQEEMRGLGLRPSDGGLRWSGVAAGREPAMRLQASLADIGAGLREIRVRAVGLAALMRAGMDRGETCGPERAQ